VRYLFYTNYQSGNSGLSNGIMSIEVGVILAHLTNRLLVLDGNVPPPANIVTYDGRVSNEQPSRVTDLLDIPVPWIEPSSVDLSGFESLELTNLPLMDFAFYFPRTLDLSSSDARSFARDRNHWMTVTGERAQIPVLRLSEDPLVPGTRRHRSNLCSYSYLFYLDNESRRSVYRLLQRMQAKRPFAELAHRVARDIGAFNAVHLRRGDFKVTYGVTTLDRKPHEAIEAMDQVFGRKEPLVIVTDERDDPFFTEIKLAYPNHYFIDWHILDNYGAEFAALPQTDSLSLAYLSQLVAAEAQEFIGTMTSTFTGLIQRYRGSRGKDEKFRYLWNELPDPFQEVERGRHAVSECIPLEAGQMVEQFPGPYSWNRVSQLLNPAWMREWPESFLLPEVVATGALPSKPASREGVVSPYVAASPLQLVHVAFENLQVAVWCEDAAMLKRLAAGLGVQPGAQARNVITNFTISMTGDSACIEQRGQSEKTVCDEAKLPVMLKQKIGTAFALARHKYSWLLAAAFAKAGRGLLIAGDMGDPNDSIRSGLETHGWELLDSELLAIRVEDLMIVPLGARARPEQAAAKMGRVATPFERLVVTNRAPLHARDVSIFPLSPAAAVASLIGKSLDFRIERDRAVNLLCRLVEMRPAAQVHFGRPHEAARVISHWADTLPEGGS
jgi:GDP-fucose protein O-fucosyltransferase